MCEQEQWKFFKRNFPQQKLLQSIAVVTVTNELPAFYTLYNSGHMMLLAWIDNCTFFHCTCYILAFTCNFLQLQKPNNHSPGFLAFCCCLVCVSSLYILFQCPSFAFASYHYSRLISYVSSTERRVLYLLSCTTREQEGF